MAETTTQKQQRKLSEHQASEYGAASRFPQAHGQGVHALGLIEICLIDVLSEDHDGRPKAEEEAEAVSYTHLRAHET